MVEAGRLTQTVYPSLGVTFISLHENVNSTTGEGMEMLSFYNIFNEWYAAERVSHTVASRKAVLTVSADIGRLLRFHFRDTLKPVKENKERTDVMNEAKNKSKYC